MAEERSKKTCVYWKLNHSQKKSPRPLLFERKPGFKVGRYRSHALEGAGRRDKSNNIDAKKERGDKARVTIKDLAPDEKKRIASLIQELARSAEEREIAVDQLQQAHAALQKQKEELSCLLREREQLAARNVESQSLASEYRKQLVAQEATLVQLKQAGLFDRNGRLQEDELMVRSGNKRPTSEPEETSDAVQHSSLAGSKVNMPYQQLTSQSQLQSYTLTQEMEHTEHVTGDSKSLSKMHSWYEHPDAIQTQLPPEETSHVLHAAASSKTRHHSKKSSASAMEPDTPRSICYSLHPESVSDDSVLHADMPETLCTEHKAVQTTLQTHQSLVSRGCQTRIAPLGESHQQTMHHCGTQTTSSLFSPQIADHACTVIAGIDVGIQTDSLLDLYEQKSHLVEQSGHLIVSALSSREKIERLEKRSDDLTQTVPAYPHNRNISVSLLELIEELELTESTGGEMGSNLELEVSNLDSEDENALLSDIFFLQS